MYYLAVDGGGTKTEAVIFNCNGEISGHGVHGGGNALLMEASKAYENVLLAAIDAIAASSLTTKDIQHGYLFIPGFTDYVEKISLELGFACHICKESDELHYTAFSGKDGIVVLAGTGSFATAYTGKEITSVGGWGDIFGDEGSGYYIGVQALRKCAVNYDKRVSTKLMKEICLWFGVNDFKQCRRLIYSSPDKRGTVAALCKLVCANASEAECDDILNQAVEHLCQLALMCLHNSGKKTMNVSLVGGLSNSKVIEEKFVRAVTNTNGSLVFHKCENDVIGGAIKMVLAQNGIF